MSIEDELIQNIYNYQKEVSNSKRKQVILDFSALIANVDQLPNKINELKSTIYANNYDALLLCEVCP